MTRRIGLGAVLLCCALLVGAVAGAFAVVRETGNRIQVLGSGDAVSVLITAGQSQLLIVTGNDRTSFGNAIDRATRGPGNAPDILVVAGSGDLLVAPAYALELFDPNGRYAAHPIHTRESNEPRLANLDPVPANPVRMTLADSVAVVIESTPVPSDDDTYAWRATVTHQSTRVAIVSEGGHVSLFDWPSPVSALVVAGIASGAPARVSGAQVIVGAASELDPSDAHVQDWGTSASAPLRIVPVRPGDMATLTFESAGLALTSDDRITTITPTPT